MGKPGSARILSAAGPARADGGRQQAENQHQVRAPPRNRRQSFSHKIAALDDEALYVVY